MIIKEHRGKACPEYPSIHVGDLVCEECDHFKFKRSGIFNKYGIEGTDEWCEKLCIDASCVKTP